MVKRQNLLSFLKEKKYVLLVFALALVFVIIESKSKGDFRIFLNASDDLLKGENIYQNKYALYYHYFYDIFFALIISPLRLLPIYWATFIWLLCNIFFTYRIWILIKNFLPLEKLNSKQIWLFGFCSFAGIFTLWHKNMHLTQMTIFILFLCLEGIYRIEKKQFLVGSMLIGIGITIKILPIVLIPYLLYRGYFKSVLYVLLSIVVLLILPSLFIGLDHNVFLLKERWSLINPLKTEHLLDTEERSFHSLTTLLSVLLVENATTDVRILKLKRNIMDISLESLKWVITIARLIIVGLALLFINRLPFKKEQSKLQVLYELSYIFIAIPLIFPHQQHYAFFFIFPALSYLVFYYLLRFKDVKNPISNWKKGMLIAFFVLLYFVINADFILGAYQNFYDHYKTLTYGILLFIPLLAFSRPKNISLMGVR